MAKVILNAKTHLTAEAVMEIFRKGFDGKYQVYKTMLLGVDFVVKKSSWTAIGVKVMQKGDTAVLRLNGLAPSAAVRILFMGLIPLLIMYLTTWKDMENEVTYFINNSKELNG